MFAATALLMQSGLAKTRMGKLCKQCGGKRAAKQRRERLLNIEFETLLVTSVIRKCPIDRSTLRHRRRPVAHFICTANQHRWLVAED